MSMGFLNILMSFDRFLLMSIKYQFKHSQRVSGFLIFLLSTSS